MSFCIVRYDCHLLDSGESENESKFDFMLYGQEVIVVVAAEVKLPLQAGVWKYFYFVT